MTPTGENNSEQARSIPGVFNRPEQKSRRRALRKNMTRAERRLWFRLRDRQLDGFKFRRQVSVGSFVLDFYCNVVKLAIEVDGDVHATDQREAADAERDLFLRSHGIQILRFTNNDVLNHTDDVLVHINNVADVLARSKNPTLTLPLKRGGKRAAAVAEAPSVRDVISRYMSSRTESSHEISRRIHTPPQSRLIQHPNDTML